MKTLDTKQVTSDIFSNHRNKRLQLYDGSKVFLDQPVKNELGTYDNIRKIASGQGDYYTTGFLLGYHISKNIKLEK